MLRIRLTLVLTTVLATAGLPAAHPPAEAAGEAWSPPVDGPVVRGYEPPDGPFGPRHLGLDYAVAAGTPVRAAGDGVVAFAGRVGRSLSVAIEHPGAQRTTYAYLRVVTVAPGRPVRRGTLLGESGGKGPGHGRAVLHFGYRRVGSSEDPAQLFHSPPRFSLAPLDRPACRRPLPRRTAGPK